MEISVSFPRAHVGAMSSPPRRAAPSRRRRRRRLLLLLLLLLWWQRRVNDAHTHTLTQKKNTLTS